MSKQMHDTPHKSRGFSIIELMIVVTIISILSVIGIPAFLKYQIGAQISEGITLSQNFRKTSLEYYWTNSKWPQNNAAAGLSQPTDYAGSYTEKIELIPNASNTIDIVITYNMSTLGDNNTLVYTPIISADQKTVTWDCTGGALTNDVRPSACRQ